MKRENAHRIIAFTAVLGFGLAALAFYSVRDMMAAFALFSVAFLGLGIALLAVLSAEEAVVWVLHRSEVYFGRFRHRHLALASHPGTQRHSGNSN
jgi:hypothetical protein